MTVLKRSIKGFTLIEVLIVVVIIAILASLILPRMTSQVGKAQAAEAFQMSGAIKRAAERQFDLTGSYAIPSGEIASDPMGVWGAAYLPNWSELGLRGLESSKSWSYFYSGSATDYEISIANGKGDAMYYGGRQGWTCSGIFTNSGDGEPALDPCTLK
ncbi:MAG TPA: prepilin-type N-terminal cleavage/methylation domain-containing protein [Candidatus Omnitrophota bacterium]|nr:prepilin-type N-terminal cleavage/methylation domain-containing protein [Candidatus Omnitrophota bacterium]HPS36386.1 prepilin-type N-terminal cleavage/methylation domain-containing protein [Candidatus Omnitrophota bacterium]